jgi:ribonuclease BN (tRNA processing enzyme)
VLVDCGATALVGLKRAGVDPNEIAAVIVSHLHGDHFGGLPFLVLDGQFRHRSTDLVVAGPHGLTERLSTTMEAMYPGMTTVRRRFDVSVVELEPGVETGVGPAEVTGVEVIHASGAPALALRVAHRGHTISYSGDTEWTPQLIDASQDADLFVCEAYSWTRKIRFHLDWETLVAHRAELACRKLAITHMGPEMLQHLDDLPADVIVAEDGEVVSL